MDPAAFAFAVLSAAELCLKSGKYLIGRYEDYRHAEQDVSEAVFHIRVLWVKTEIQLESIIKLWRSIDPRLQALFYDLLCHLQGKLEIASASLDRVAEMKLHETVLAVKKFKAMRLKSSIQQAVWDLENWQKRFDPSWWLITRVANPEVDRYLQERDPKTDIPTGKLKQLRDAMSQALSAKQGSIFINQKILTGDSSLLPWSSVYTTCLPGSDNSILVDTITYDLGSDLALATLHVRDLTRRLSNSDPDEFGLLRCRGVAKCPTADDTKFQLVFEIPRILSNPRALREILIHRVPHSLDQRFQLAKQLVRSLMFVHTSGLVHKSIRPETIIVFQENEAILGPSFLVGFEQFRSEAGETLRIGDSSWENNLYRHPQRQGVHPEERYVMQHDIYSLGVCLLEVGLWNLFVQLGGNDSLEPSKDLDIAKDELVSGKKAKFVKRSLVQIASERLPGLMGQHYANLAKSCLSCLDTGDLNLFGKEQDLEDEDGIVVGVQFIEKILLQIEDIRI